jgi:hypothetical protein
MALFAEGTASVAELEGREEEGEALEEEMFHLIEGQQPIKSEHLIMDISKVRGVKSYVSVSIASCAVCLHMWFPSHRATAAHRLGAPYHGHLEVSREHNRLCSCLAFAACLITVSFNLGQQPSVGTSLTFKDKGDRGN